MNYIINDNGDFVIAIGAPGSVARVKTTCPRMIAFIRRQLDTGALTKENAAKLLKKGFYGLELAALLDVFDLA